MIKFYSMRKKFFAISLTIFLIGIVAAIINGVSLDIQFKGGSIIKYAYEGDIDLDNFDKIVTETLNRQADIQETLDIATQQKRLIINLSGKEGLLAEEQQKLEEVLQAQYADAGIRLSESSVVEPFIGKRFLQKAVISIVLSSILVVLYVWFSFRKIGGLSAGVMALVALFHDVIVVFITFVVFRIPINESFIAAALTIIGFSINDTIVIYDRIRENTQLYKKTLSLEEIVDKSINQSLTRSINTNLATFLSVACIYIFTEIYGITSMRSFSLPMMVGVLSGCYSTICIAGPLWVMWQNYKSKKKAIAHS